ncbi:unnamed protein product [Schistocephalus solidus]|uniref:Mediator of RNA polymerase II transcription subunit 7 n=1 Tax=Schistocephalus solidus TaxID=70667 RepID=A0A183TE68_SCHSO|nr:unnamed protein product [Schistocephalus solidus]
MNDKVESSKSEDDSLITADFQHEYATLVLHLDELNRQLRYHIDVVLLHITKPPPPLPDGSVFECPPTYPVVEAPTSAVSEYVTLLQGRGLSMNRPLASDQVSTVFEADYIHDLNTSSIRVDCDIAADYGMPNIACLTDWRRRCEDEAFEMVNRLKTAQGRAIIEESKSVLIAKLTSILTLLAHLQDDKMTNDKLSCIEEVFADIRQRLHPNNLKCFEQSVEQLISHIVLNLSPSILAVQPAATSGQNSYSRHQNS